VFTGTVEHSFVGETEWHKIMNASAKRLVKLTPTLNYALEQNWILDFSTHTHTHRQEAKRGMENKHMTTACLRSTDIIIQKIAVHFFSPLETTQQNKRGAAGLPTALSHQGLTEIKEL